MKPQPFLFAALIALSPALFAEAPAPAAAPAAAAPAKAEDPPEVVALRKQQEKLVLENGIAEQSLKQALAKLAAEKARLELENAVAAQKLQGTLAELQAQIEGASKKTDLIAKQTALKDAERKVKLETELAAQREEIERLKVESEVAVARNAARTRELQMKDQELQVRAREIQNERAEFEIKVAKLSSEIDLREKKDLWKNRVNGEIAYTLEPYKAGVLTISDRRIALNGPIGLDTADYIQERVDYFNNQSREFPIFIVIDRSPGGSVMAGYKILKAMEGSPAPVYVVVKSFAASMAAGITTLAKKSFAYPNAILLHHQILSGNFGNLSEQRDQLKELEEWWRRLAAPVAKKMGVSLDEFIKEMYKNRTSGDWQEFADRAKQIKWVDEVVETIREESFVKNPDADPPKPAKPLLDWRVEQRDAEGRPFVLLPRLEPVDMYYLYNPDGYYRLAR
jgi:ATP-dependent Clp protease protease subunit